MNIDKISKITLWSLMGISVVIFILFFLVGFATPWEENPKQYDPQFTDALIIWSMVLSAATFVIMLVSFFMYVKEYGFNKSYLYTWGLPIITLAIGAAIGFSNKHEVMLINGKDWNTEAKPEVFNMVLTDSTMVSIGILFIIAIIAIIYSIVIKGKK